MAVRFDKQISNMEEMTIWEQYTITLNKDSKLGFGIAISGGRDKLGALAGDAAVVVSDVVRGGPAAGRLQTRDRIVMVNGVSMENATSTYAIQHLRSCGKTANITVKRPRTVQIPLSTSSQNSVHTTSRASARSENDSWHHRSPMDDDDSPPTHRHYREQQQQQNYRSNNYPSETGSGSEGSYVYPRRDGNSFNGPQHRSRTPSSDSRRSRETDSVDGRRFSSNQNQNDAALALMSEYKRLPSHGEPYKPARVVLVKKQLSDEYGLKLGSQIFIKHMTPTGLASQEGSLQEGDLVLKINGIATENMSLADTKRLVERSEGKLTMTVVRDGEQFLVNIPEVEDSEGESSDLEDISDIEHEETPSPPKRLGSLDSRIPDRPEEDHRSIPPVPEGEADKAVPMVYASREEEPIYCLPPDSIPNLQSKSQEDLNSGYSSDLKQITFLKEESVGLRLVGGNDVGIFVGGVQDGSMASKQGIQEGDQILKVNEEDFTHLTREEAVLYLLNIPRGERVKICAQSKPDIYRKMVTSAVGDHFFIRTHFEHDTEIPSELSFVRGDVFRVLDTMHRGKLGSWLVVRLGSDLQDMEKGIIPSKSRAEQIATVDKMQKVGNPGASSGLRAEFWKLRGLRGAKKNLRKSRDDLTQLTIQNKYPPYEKVQLREASFKRPIVVLGPLSDVALQMLSTDLPHQFQMAQTVPRDAEGKSSSVIRLETVKEILAENKHPLLDITPSAIERLNYIQLHPMVFFLEPQSKQDVKTMRQRLCPDSKKSSRRLYAQAVKMRKYCSHLFSARIALQPNSIAWYEILKDKVKDLQSRPVWFSDGKMESEAEQDLDTLGRDRSSDYLSCDSRATSDYEDMDGEGGGYTDNELDDAFEGTALARSSEPFESPQPMEFQPAFPQGQESSGQYRRFDDHRESDWRQPHFRQSGSSEEKEDDRDYDWGPATDL
ncbi:tight junction protein ZO-3 isoform X1 [Polypterus senegalus]|uniref:tight junction protein ZO-3 isoform X1 n=2 Tax=Polypterus senegalus TaxID=55291 RepID=UPI001963C6D4|nr:tight junction protein ZO-3 isoform X1 [Polypterus senegalus]